MAAAVVVVFLVLVNLVLWNGRMHTEAETVEETTVPAESAESPEQTEGSDAGGETGESATASSIFFSGYEPDISGAQAVQDPEVNSPYAVLVNLDTGKVVAAREADTVISPASMTKIMTILVAAEHVQNLDDTFTITQEISDYVYQNDCSIAGFLAGDTMTIRDLMYGTILPSGADASLGLATYIAGSQDAFVEMMNQKAADLGLSDTAHFTSCIGIYNEDNHCTVTDMAMILKAALENDLAKEILSAHTYTTGPTAEHPEGIQLSNWFLRRIEDKDSKGTVVAAKTGYVLQSGNCAASYNEANDGGHYICVTAGAHSSWRCIYDHVAIYQEFLG